MNGIRLRFLAPMLCAGVLALSVQPNTLHAQARASRAAADLVDARCSLCHGPDGESVSSLYPRLAGQHPEYIEKQLRDFREGRRKGTMNEMAADLSDDEVRALAAYFSNKNVPVAASADADLAAVGRYIYRKGNAYSGVPACAGCHGPSGMGTAKLPRLSGQRASYIERQLKQFSQRERTNDNAIMHSVASRLTELEARAVAEFAAALQ